MRPSTVSIICVQVLKYPFVIQCAKGLSNIISTRRLTFVVLTKSNLSCQRRGIFLKHPLWGIGKKMEYLS